MTSIYVIAITYPDRVSIVHSRCFASELAARCDVEILAEGQLDWQTRTYAVDERKIEFSCCGGTQPDRPRRPLA